MTDDSGDRDNRKSGRRRTLFGGVIYDGKGGQWDCSVSDLSEIGAKVRTKAEFVVGEGVELKINKYNSLHRASIAWVREGFIGLEFKVPLNRQDDEIKRLFNLVI
ncbi:MAG: PilZ domain-containing protein [Rhodospirillaceae bacterium]|nr:PilZ domain-containing protein [Rhodospirillaceae bacterium]